MISDWTTVEPFLKSLRPLFDDEEITNIMANPDGAIFYEKRGAKHRAEGITLSEADKSFAAQNIARMEGQDIDKGTPHLTSRLPDGGRIAILSPRVALGGHCLTIRRFPKRRFTLDELESFGAFPHHVAELLRDELAAGSNMLIVGSVNAGKTTLLNALCLEIDDNERIMTIEDIAELNIRKPDVVGSQALEGTQVSVTIADLLKQALRHNPTRIIMGEIRGKEASNYLEATNLGIPGCMSTIHANSGYEALYRLTNLAHEANPDRPYVSIQRAVALSIKTVVFQTYNTKTGERSIDHIIHVNGFDNQTLDFRTSFLYERNNAHRLTVAMTNHSATHPQGHSTRAANTAEPVAANG